MFFLLLIWGSSGIPAALTSEASWVITLLGILAVCYNTIKGNDMASVRYVFSFQYLLESTPLPVLRLF
jgi:hypothetical protein